jgi:predicted GIY-YIG superfamily endonuclease
LAGSFNLVPTSSHNASTSTGSVPLNAMPYFIYILLCNQKTYYVGITDNLERRLNEHKNKKSFYTKQFSDINMVYSEKVNIIK